MIFSSKVPFVMSRYTFTTFFCPIRCARSIAWRSFIGFQSCSTNITVSAPVSVNPRPPTCVVNNNTSILGSELHVCTMAWRFTESVEPSSRMYVTEGMCFLKRSVSMISIIWRIWQKTRTRCCEMTLEEASPSVSISSLLVSSAAEVLVPMPQSFSICLSDGNNV